MFHQNDYALLSESNRNRLSYPRHDHQQCICNELAVAEHLCAGCRVKLTPIRRKALELIWKSHRAVKAYDLLDQMKPKQQSAKLATVYRALDFLLEQGLIHREKNLNTFTGCNCLERQHEHLFLICVQCHEIEERPGMLVIEAVALKKFSRRTLASSITRRNSRDV